MSNTAQSRKQFVQRLLRWYKKNSRNLPWRRTKDPYAILVSEIMLQQTQVDRVIPYFHQWMKQFPTVHALAGARTGDVLQTWKGLGYNRRALYLQRTAQAIVNTHHGVFPTSTVELEQLPGIGPYTARAVASFAFNADEPIVDTNVTRVVGRVFIGFKKLPHTAQQRIWTLAQHLIPKKGKTYTFNQALMDFGATVCTLRTPRCTTCPLRTQCRSYPAIVTASNHELRYQKTSPERKYFRYPRRIWRGKILHMVATNEPNGMTLGAIGRTLQKDFSPQRRPWLQSTIQTLINDGLMVRRGQRFHLPR